MIIRRVAVVLALVAVLVAVVQLHGTAQASTDHQAPLDDCSELATLQFMLSETSQFPETNEGLVASRSIELTTGQQEIQPDGDHPEVCRLRLVRVRRCTSVWIGSLGIWSQECEWVTESRCD
jgi:hypothetical protein